jgi:TonB-like protein/PilZ domain-containing protein
MLIERRACQRVNVLADGNGMILVDVPSLGTTGLLVDLSEDGLGVQFAVPIPDVATIDVDFSLGQRRVTGTCDAVWSTPSTRGLHFRALPEQDRAEIRSWLQSLQSTNQLTPSIAFSDLSDLDAPQPSEAPPIWQETVESLLAANGPQDSGTPLEVDAPVSTTAGVTPSGGTVDGNSGEIEDTAGCDANAASAVPPIRPGVWDSDGRFNRTQPDWAIRIGAARRQQALMERLTIWRDGHESAHELVPTPDSQPLLTDEMRRSLSTESRTQLRGRTYLRGLRWAIILAITVTGGLNLSRLHRTADPDASAVRAYWVGDRLESKKPAVVGVVEIVEGEATPHSHARSKGRSQKITPGTAVVRDVPSYDHTAMASGTQGDVHAVLTISDRGIVQNVRVTEGDDVFAKQVATTTAHWRYTPYFDDSGPVSVDLPVAFKFRLQREQK